MLSQPKCKNILYCSRVRKALTHAFLSATIRLQKSNAKRQFAVTILSINKTRNKHSVFKRTSFVSQQASDFFCKRRPMKEKIKSEFQEFKTLLRSVPAPVVSIFVVTVVIMNLLANKSIDLKVDWLALDAGFIVSWATFLSMDVIAKHFGPKAANQISVFAVLVNLAVALILFVGSVIPGTWGESYVEGSQGVINSALDNTFGGTWYVLLGSTVAFVASAFVNNFINWSIGKALKDKKDNFFVFALRTYVSTAVGQFVDNLIFAFIVSLNFFGWSPLQCVTCALTGMVAELLFEVVFSHLGYLICKKWKKDNVGEAYFALRAQKEQTV